MKLMDRVILVFWRITRYCKTLLSATILIFQISVLVTDYSTENSQKTLTLLHENLRSINNFQNFDAFEEFLTDLSFSFRHRVCIRNAVKRRTFWLTFQYLITNSFKLILLHRQTSLLFTNSFMLILLHRQTGLLFTYHLNLLWTIS